MAAKSTDRFEHESLQSAGTIGAYLEALAAGLRDGSLTLASDDEELVLQPDGMLELRVRAQQKKDGRTRLDLRIEWQERGEAGDDGELRIGPASSEER